MREKREIEKLKRSIRKREVECVCVYERES